MTTLVDRSENPRVSAGFALGSAQEPELGERNATLSDAMMDEGFDCPLDCYMRLAAYKLEHQLGRVGTST